MCVAEAKASMINASSCMEYTRNRVIYPWPGGTSGNTEWMAEPIDVEKSRDELWIGAKDQSNSVIAGSLRNSLRVSLVPYFPGVEH